MKNNQPLYQIDIHTAKPYPVFIGNELLPQIGEVIAQKISKCKIMLVCDSNVDPLYGNEAAASLKKRGFVVVRYVFPEGERSKSINRLAHLLEAMAENNMTKQDVVVALGGGVTGDLAGFAASVYLRGVQYVQVPTTLLAAVDSSVGGKTAVNLNAGKNLAGSFHQPLLVICDCHTFQTLKPQVYADGMAETIKYGMITAPKLFKEIQNGSYQNNQNTAEMVSRCVDIKRAIVEADEHDNGSRQLLNFGHTVGHAIEKCSNFSISHGQAVAIGMLRMARAAEQIGFCKEPCSQVLEEVLKQNNLPTETSFSTRQLTNAALMDKKRRGETITLVLPKKVGTCELYETAVENLQSILKAGEKHG